MTKFLNVMQNADDLDAENSNTIQIVTKEWIDLELIIDVS